MGRAGLEKNPRQVAAMFDGVARRYDRFNSLVSFGQDRRWRRQTVRSMNLGPGRKVLDVAAGTAVSTVQLAATGAWCVATDFSLGMLAAGSDRSVPKVAGDAMRLPFADASFDAVTISFGLRNVQDAATALREFARVTKPGGELLVCEFSTPRFPPARWFYSWYRAKGIPWLAKRFSSNPEAYSYLGESIGAWPDRKALARTITESGWTDVAWRTMTFGVVALHHAERRVSGASQDRSEERA